MQNPSAAHALAYRPDIDGLRAIAVLAVVAYHAAPAAMPGGFVGVDVFFVISGFLISSLLYRDLERGSLSLGRFYARRVRRIFPALAVVLLFCVAAGWWLYDADEYRLLGRHVVASVAFLQNVALYREIGYFDTAAASKALLHLWSLSVEEQFYLVWPFAVAWSWRRRAVAPFLAAAILLSLGASVVLTGVDRSAAFYLPGTRLWELAAGGALAYAALRAPDALAWRRDAQAVAGAVLLVLSFALIDDARRFPGAWALLPVLGSVLLIAAGPTAWVNRRGLAHPVAVRIGLISYPLYLWHWVLLTFVPVAFGTATPLTTVAALATAFLLAEATYRLVERPIRFSARHWPLAALPAAMAALAAFGLWVHARRGVPSREMARRLAPFVWAYDARAFRPCDDASLVHDGALGYCLVNASRATDAVLLGDSHAGDKFPGIASADPSRAWALVGHPSCPPVYGVNVIGAVADCRRRSERAIDWAASQPGVRIVALAFFGSYVATTSYAADHLGGSPGPREVVITADGAAGASKAELFHRGLAAAVRRLTAAGKQVVVFVDVPELPFAPKQCVRHDRACSVARADVLARQAPHRDILARLRREYPGVSVFDPLALSCDAERCSHRSGGAVYYRDSHHLSADGSALFGRAFVRWLAATP